MKVPLPLTTDDGPRTNPAARRLALAAAVILCVFSGIAAACNVPVFRYALEHWRPDPYRLTVVHRGSLSADHQAALAKLEDDASRLNVAVRPVDLETVTEEADSISEADLPQMVIQYPAGLRLDAPIVKERFSEETIAKWLDSPIRRELVKRLAVGQTAVWVVLTTGDESLDQPASQLLDEELPKLARKLKLPELTESPEDVLLGSTPLKVEFSTLTVRRDDPAEQPLVAMLLGCEEDLATTNEPMVFPVFGRCRVLLPLIGAGISADNLYTSAAFLTGACSCQVKNQNPGFDLLHIADWAGELRLDADPATTLTAAAEPELVTIPSGTVQNSTPSSSVAVPSTGVPLPPPMPPYSLSLSKILLVTAVVAGLAIAICRRSSGF